MNPLKNALMGFATTVLASFLVALVFAFLFRFPIPFVGYIGLFAELSPYSIGVLKTIKSVVIAWWFYGILGGYLVLGISGIITGLYIGHKFSDSDNKNKRIIIGSIAISAIPVFVLSLLDFVIGPW